jgi:hypothetical protein
MEETELIDSKIPEEPQGILLLPDAQDFLLETGKWARFLGVIGYIGAGLIILVGLFFTLFMSKISQYQTTSPMPAFFGGALGFFYILAGVFHFFIARYLHQFGTNIKEGISFSESHIVSAAFSKLKSLFKMLGITTIVVLALYLLVLIAMIIGAAIGFSMMHHG